MSPLVRQYIQNCILGHPQNFKWGFLGCIICMFFAYYMESRVFIAIAYGGYILCMVGIVYNAIFRCKTPDKAYESQNKNQPLKEDPYVQFLYDNAINATLKYQEHIKNIRNKAMILLSYIFTMLGVMIRYKAKLFKDYSNGYLVAPSLTLVIIFYLMVCCYLIYIFASPRKQYPAHFVPSALSSLGEITNKFNLMNKLLPHLDTIAQETMNDMNNLAKHFKCALYITLAPAAIILIMVCAL